MNWFERYGIVGMFFGVMTGVWFFCLFPDAFYLLNSNINNVVLVKYIAGFCGLGILPIGYLMCILGQKLYYCEKYQKNKNLWEKIHCKYWENLSDPIKEEIQKEEIKIVGKKLSEDDQKDEATMEAIVTYYDRMGFKNLEKNKFLSLFVTKRYDVVAINRGIFLSIIASLVCAVSLELIIVNFTIKELFMLFGYKYFSFFFAIIVAGAIWILLRKSTATLEKQIIEVGKRQNSNIDVSKIKD